MPLPVTLASTYLALNLAFMAWLIREEVRGHEVAGWVRVTSRITRYGPPFLGVLYLITLAGDWPFVVFVATFFAGAFWLLGGLLNYPTRPPKR